MASANLFVGCAGWNIHPHNKSVFPTEGSHLERYGARLGAVEINSSFYKPHRPATYARWAASVPGHFRFAVKFPKEVTHVRRLADFDEPMGQFFEAVQSLEDKVGPILIQTPPSLQYELPVAAKFLAALRRRWQSPVVLEPRHPTWFEADVDRLLKDSEIMRVAADPACVAAAAEPSCFGKLAYYRLHGSPRVYYSSYPDDYLKELAAHLARELERGREVWCVFDNTALGAAAANAFRLLELLRSQSTPCE